MTEAMLGELLAVVGMASETNALAEAYQIPVDDRFRVVARIRVEDWPAAR
jgi:hypothetical protein